MTRDSEAAPAGDSEGRTVPTTDQEAAPTTVATPSPVDSERAEATAANGRLVTLHLPPDTDPATLGIILGALVDSLAPGSTSATLLGHLAQQLHDLEHLQQLAARVDAERENHEQRRVQERLSACWPRVMEDHARHHGYTLSWHLFVTEWEKYPDPATGLPYPLADGTGARRRVMRLGFDGVPWFVVRDVIHDVLTATEDRRTLDTVVRRCRRHIRRQQERAELRLIRGDA